MPKKEADFQTLVEGPVLKKSESIAIRMSLISVNGVEMFDFRQMYRTTDSKKWKPTPKGFTLPVDKALSFAIKAKRFIKDEIVESTT